MPLVGRPPTVPRLLVMAGVFGLAGAACQKGEGEGTYLRTTSFVRVDETDLDETACQGIPVPDVPCPNSHPVALCRAAEGRSPHWVVECPYNGEGLDTKGTSGREGSFASPRRPLCPPEACGGRPRRVTCDDGAPPPTPPCVATDSGCAWEDAVCPTDRGARPLPLGTWSGKESLLEVGVDGRAVFRGTCGATMDLDSFTLDSRNHGTTTGTLQRPMTFLLPNGPSMNQKVQVDGTLTDTTLDFVLRADGREVLRERLTLGQPTPSLDCSPVR